MYITREGKIINNDTNQDKLLNFMYSCSIGRSIIKVFVNPVISKMAGGLLNTKASALLIAPFIKANHIDMTQYENRKYNSYNDFFTRKIKINKRKIDYRTNVLISPCDSKLSVYKIDDNSTFCIKNTKYTLESLLRNHKLAKSFNGGYCMVFRLTVDDYHRYINVDSGNIISRKKINGILHTVNPVANDYYPIYKENSREYVLVKGNNIGKYIQMEVGALMVGKISNHQIRNYTIIKGSEKGYFEFGGSTIILLLNNDKIHIDRDLINNSKNGYETIVKLGEKIGELY